MPATGSEARNAALARVAGPRRRMVLAALAGSIVALVAVLVLVLPGSPPPSSPATRSPTFTSRPTAQGPAVRAALRVASRFPTFPLISGIVTARLADIASGTAAGGSGSSLNYQSSIRPWLGKEAAIAFLANGTSTAGSEIRAASATARRRAAFWHGPVRPPRGATTG